MGLLPLFFGRMRLSSEVLGSDVSCLFFILAVGDTQTLWRDLSNYLKLCCQELPSQGLFLDPGQLPWLFSGMSSHKAGVSAAREFLSPSK